MVGVRVSGMGVAVAVGSAAFVMAISVHAAATAVFCISIVLTVGVAGPQAVRVRIIMIDASYRNFLFICSP